YDVSLQASRDAVNAETARLAEAAQRIDVAKKQLAETQYRLESAKATLQLQEANLRQAESDLTRAERLFAKQIIPEQQYERMRTTRDIAKAQVDVARDQLRQAQAAIETQQGVISQSAAAAKAHGELVSQRQQAMVGEVLKVGYTKIYAPADGYVTKKTVEVGNQIQAGQPLLAVVPLGDVWVVANYKETELERVRPGQEAQIRVDTYSGRVFTGKVDSIMAGTGSAFSLFPPENATGNYVKVVQRIPVKIVLEKGADPGHLLRVGMSVQPTILANP
ncbi:MAG: HlyD family secretion protein, partial [Smithellaceae bacterium]|nr:HlyD family secretion protein [Smithellaceae bacterium]